MTYLLDTNACIALINGRPEAVRRRFERASSAGESLATSSIVLFELWYGVAKSQRSKANAERVATFLAGPLEVFDFTTEDADHAGRVRAALENRHLGFVESCCWVGGAFEFTRPGAVWDAGRIRGRLRALGVRRRLVSAQRLGVGQRLIQPTPGFVDDHRVGVQVIR